MTDQVVFQFSTTTDTLANWSSALIRRLCHSPFSHVDMVLPNGNLLGASDSPDAPAIAGNPRGVAVRPPDYQEWGIRRRMIITTEKADAIVAAGLTQLGKPFDHTALHEFISDSFPDARNWRDPGQWFCAEWGTWSMETAEYWAPRALLWPKSRVSPTDLLLLFIFDPNFVNRDAFWQPVPGLQLGPREH